MWHYIFTITLAFNLLACKNKKKLSASKESVSQNSFFGNWESSCLLKKFEGKLLGIKAEISISQEGFELLTNHYDEASCQDIIFSETHEGYLRPVNNTQEKESHNLVVANYYMTLIDEFLTKHYQEKSLFGIKWDKNIKTKIPNYPLPDSQDLGIITISPIKVLEFFPGTKKAQGMPMVFLKKDG